MLHLSALFTRWSDSDKKTFNIPGLSPDAMQLILDYAYTGSFSVTEDNVQELLLAADQFNIVNGIQICYKFLEEQMSPENCIGIWHFTNICIYPEMRRKAYNYIITHFEEVASCEELLQLSVEKLIDIIERDDLIVKEENTVFEAITTWIAHLPEERERHIAPLLSKVQYLL